MIPTATRVAGALALACAMLAACGDDRPPSPDIAEVFPNLPLPPHPSVVSRSGGADAIQLTLRTPRPQKAVESYYLSVLSGEGWRLVKQTRAANGDLVLYAEQDGPPLWVRIRADPEGSATLVELAGAISQPPDTAKAKPAS